MRRPIIGIPCDVKRIGLLPFHAVAEKYAEAVSGGVGGVPLLIPALGSRSHVREILDTFDGILLTGSLSNIEPHHYGGAPSRPGSPHDPQRDATTLPLIDLLLQEGIPLLGICRGFQEINVALGGELFQHVQEEPGFADHREPETDDLDEMYVPAHVVHFTEGSLLRQWLGCDSIEVNSLHQQGIKRLAQRLEAEAVADDGLIEAYRVRDARTFSYAVQWHPEWKYHDNAISIAIFNAFGAACRERVAARAKA